MMLNLCPWKRRAHEVTAWRGSSYQRLKHHQGNTAKSKATSIDQYIKFQEKEICSPPQNRKKKKESDAQRNNFFHIDNSP
jgi:hypothetical protein